MNKAVRSSTDSRPCETGERRAQDEARSRGMEAPERVPFSRGRRARDAGAEPKPSAAGGEERAAVVPWNCLGLISPARSLIPTLPEWVYRDTIRIA
jgi:hypothetical protein